MKNLVEKLEKSAKQIEPWMDGHYLLPFADLRELLEAAAKRLRELGDVQ